jgi:bacterioferritin-associated ferredoxin
LLVCHCQAVHEAALREVIDAGARDEFDVAQACGAGSVCGGCVPTISRMLGECRGCPLQQGLAEGQTAASRPDGSDARRAGQRVSPVG